MAEEKEPNRAERRRLEKEAAKPKIKAECSQCKEGPCAIAPKNYDKCPVCGCPATFTVEAIKGDLQLEDILGKEPALFSFEYLYDTPSFEVKLIVVGACCARCGVFRALARDKLQKGSLVVLKRPGGDGGLRGLRRY